MQLPNFDTLPLTEEKESAVKYDKKIKSIVMDPNNRNMILLITASSELVRLNLDTLVAKHVQKLPFETKRVIRTKCSSRGTICVQTDKNSIVNFNLNSNSIISTIRLEKFEITAFELFFDDSEALFVGSSSGFLYYVPIKQDNNALIDESAGKHVQQDRITDILVASKDLVFTSSFDNQIKSIKTKETSFGIDLSFGSVEEASLDLVMDIPMKLEMSECCMFLFAGAMDGTVYEISLDEFNSELAFDFGFGSIRFLKSLFDKQLVVVDEAGKIGVLDIESGSLLEEASEPSIVDFAYSNGFLYVLIPDGEIHTYSFTKYLE